MGANVAYSNKILIWKATDGPYSVDDLPEEDLDEGHDFYYQWWVNVMVSDPMDQELWGETDLWFHSLDEAYKFMKNVNYSPKPLEVEL